MGCQTAGITCTATNLSLAAANQAPGGLSSPVNGVVTSWRAAANMGTGLQLRILGPAGGTTFSGAGTSAPASFPGPGISPVFPTSLPINIGDWIGLDSHQGELILGVSPAIAGAWAVPALADGTTRATTATVANREVLVQATIEPDNRIEFGKLKRNLKKGIVKLRVRLPNAGELTFGGNKVKTSRLARASRTIGGPGEVTVTIKAKGKKKRKLKNKGKVKVKPVFFFTPANGTTNRQPKKLALKLKKKRR